MLFITLFSVSLYLEGSYRYIQTCNTVFKEPFNPKQLNVIVQELMLSLLLCKAFVACYKRLATAGWLFWLYCCFTYMVNI